MNNETSSLYKSVDELRSVHSSVNDALLAKLTSNATTVKRHYLAMEFNKINNHEFYDEKLYSLNTSIGLKINQQDQLNCNLTSRIHNVILFCQN